MSPGKYWGGKEEEEAAASFFFLMFMVMLMSYLVWNILADNRLFCMFKILLNSTLAQKAKQNKQSSPSQEFLPM